MGHLVDGRRIRRIDVSGDGSSTDRPDALAVEEPLTLRVNGVVVTTTMRTPGHDLDLALGWLVAEGSVRRSADVVTAIACDDNTVDVALAQGVTPPRVRLTVTSSACGVCGADAVDDVLGRLPAISASSVELDARVLTELPDALRAAQPAFGRTGGLHAAGLFTLEGEAVCVREDVGRHNAVDKVVGWALREGLLPASEYILQVSGRASFELTQKAALAGVAALCAVSAPSTLAVDVARATGLVLVGFVRGSTMNVYSGAERVRLTTRVSGGA
jgi:FdhD protein